MRSTINETFPFSEIAVYEFLDSPVQRCASSGTEN